MIASYDTVYIVSVVVLSQCRQRIVTTTIELYYGKYGHILINNKHTYMYCSIILSASVNCQNPARLVDESIAVIGFREPATRGANLTLACDSGLMFTGPNSSICMENGEW